MSNAAHLLPKDVAAAAAAIANARAARRGATGIRNVLDVLPQNLFDEVIADARVALAAAAAAAVLPSPRPPAPLTAADAEALRLELNAGTVLILVRDRQGRASAALSAVSAGARVYGHDEGAQDLWALFAQARGESLTPPDQQEPTP